MAAALAGSGKKNKFDLGQNSDINVTPFVDVMLVLLIIFMVSAPLATVAIKIDLPPATDEKQENKKPVFISLTADLARALAVPKPKNETVLIRADRTVRYGDFMSVVNQLQTDGYYKVAL